MTASPQRNGRGPCGNRSCPGELDLATIVAGDEVRVFKTWHTVLAVQAYAHGIVVTVPSPESGVWGAGTFGVDVTEWCPCLHRTAEQVMVARVSAEGSVQLDLFGAAA